MRNLFDQYQGDENRLSHALASVLSRDQRLLRSFVRWATGRSAPARKLEVWEQSRPGELPARETDTERRGLPDIWIDDGSGWALLIESKVQAGVTYRQLASHFTSAELLGRHARLLLLTADPPRTKLPPGTRHRYWREVYTWLRKRETRSSWAGELLEFMEIMEARMGDRPNAPKGTLTEFSGFRFAEGVRWSYPQAKRMLRLAMQELREDKELHSALGIDPAAGGRPAITDGGGIIWDLIRLEAATSDANHTHFPGLTLALSEAGVLAILSIPNGVRTAFRKRLLGEDFDHFQRVLGDVASEMSRGLKGAKNASPRIGLLQRRYRSQRSVPFIDAEVEIDLRTAFPRPGKQVVKHQPQWLEMIYRTYADKNSNMHMHIGALFPAGRCPVLEERRILRYICSAWIACKPVLDVMKTSDPYV